VFATIILSIFAKKSDGFGAVAFLGMAIYLTPTYLLKYVKNRKNKGFFKYKRYD
jgi:hypothetical protein